MSSRLHFSRTSLFFSLVILTTVIAIDLVMKIFLSDSVNVLNFFYCFLFGMLIFGLSISFWTNIIGFFVLLKGGDRHVMTHVSNQRRIEDYSIQKMNVLVMPICNEDLQEVFATLQATYQSLLETGHGDYFEIFILSDTTHPQLQIQEEKYWHELRKFFNAENKIFYRHRANNTGKKSGNIIEFCQRWGARYHYMIVLDADSIMSGETILKLVSAIDAKPEVAIIQTLPLPINQTTLFGRIMQFSSSLYAPIHVAGTAYWQLSKSTYWGHNAIIHLKAFIENCHLPCLPGKPPLGGEILSHDFVEAALLREANWQIWLDYNLSGSYETVPPTVMDYVKRDRRWCQGNLQHSWFLISKNFSLRSRLYFLSGIMSYLVSPLWLILLVLGGDIVAHQSKSITPLALMQEGFLSKGTSHSSTFHSLILLLIIMGMFFIPKILSLLLVSFQSKQNKPYGSYFKLFMSALLECLIGFLLTPILMLYRTQFILAILCRYNIGWPQQNRAGKSISWKTAMTNHGMPMLIGLSAMAIVYYFLPGYLFMFSLVIIGPLLAVPLSKLLGSTYWGDLTARLRLFATPVEINPPSVVTLYHQAIKKWKSRN